MSVLTPKQEQRYAALLREADQRVTAARMWLQAHPGWERTPDRGQGWLYERVTVPALSALQAIRFDVKAPLTLRCAEDCGRVLASVYQTPAGPLWVPLKDGSQAITDIDLDEVVLLEQPIEVQAIVPRCKALHPHRVDPDGLESRAAYLLDELRNLFDRARATGQPQQFCVQVFKSFE